MTLQKPSSPPSYILNVRSLSIVLLLFSDIIIQTNNLFIFRDLLNFTAKCIEGQIKAFSFLFCTASDVKSTKGWEHLYTE